MERLKMSREERAKQFMPFAALKGHKKALEEKEKPVVEKMELSEERAEELSFQLSQIRKNDMITVVYFQNRDYLKITGMVSKIDFQSRYLKIVNVKIPFRDIYDLSADQTTHIHHLE
ncbi:YolD-like family protein [Sellimonas sp.]|uniref:YolD-like family protein n=1 Tax=Sellimonas sp. TaxID=2021466 RepID=UPI0026CF388F